ncbi:MULTISPECIES: type VI secretion system baseplate subunit TssE [unclassified Herbaspirillum]|uniref:type VI secretion system baseplate subunit TssE n=1 Tax=unclassified Herbaspirillum TaxID=2624150 RepID=UPI000C0921CD|nr:MULTISPECIES: type VI secretion system baseplate subunit TssE [unclassified Herbaspirillum]MAF04630.1 type VI secretion system baseplate subunit TssE [Herbaspirillum sp.]MBO18372.1 type VI secretion system baseplate subunit TssE [Herbaspirillum sp.]|tara:strand:+ start:248 stop:664 length:417 start_codon:yes stop_codon:yes gene_type:complete
MRERRLLERIANWSEADAERTSQTQVDILVRSVNDHLSRLLNTRQGSVPIDPYFGVPDFTNLAGGTGRGSVTDMEEEIRRMVLKYEPRVKSPRVLLNAETTDVLSIRFSLQGTLEVDNREIPLQISTTVGSNGKVRIG